MTNRTKQRSDQQEPELTDEELECAVGGAGMAVGGTTLYGPVGQTAPPKPAAAGQSLAGLANAQRDWRAIAASNGIEDPRGDRTNELMEISGIQCKIA